ncbi:MAG: hypothetical protein OXG09_01270 [Chloroflexi bacterium]|nr:hypothetical protein [Chloroflexota bacterium]
MITFEHKQLLKKILDVDFRLPNPPDDPVEKEEWFSAEKHLELLLDNAEEGELIIYSLTKHFMVNSIIVKKSQIEPIDSEDILKWSGNAFTVRAEYVHSNYEESQVKLDVSGVDYFNNSFMNSEQLVFVRDSGGISEPIYEYEILQEYLHASEVYWSSNHNAYCCFDELGDLVPTISISHEKKDDYSNSLVTFKRESLERYLTVTDSVLVRMFEVMIYDKAKVSRIDRSVEFENFYPSNKFLYRKLVDPQIQTWTLGVQVIPPFFPKPAVISSIIRDKFYFEAEKYEEFIAYDFRNGRIVEISTEPSATTNYFVTENNNLPFETSPAFFKAEVLQKYKGNPDKYRVSDRFIACRNAWSLEYSINEADQVFVYIYKLRRLPHQEQLYWKSFNDLPRNGISKRAYFTDFKGSWEPVEEELPHEKIREILQKWDSQGSSWWKLLNESLLDSVVVPYDNNSKEWGEAFKRLTILIIEGFRTRHIKKIMQGNQIPLGNNQKSLELLERLMCEVNEFQRDDKLKGLRMAQKIRSKVDAHFTGSEAEQLKNYALEKHGSYANHFKHVCQLIVEELESIEMAFSLAKNS